MDITMKRAAELAISVQDACNLSGVVHSFSQVMSAVWKEAERTQKGTDWVNTHPITLMFVSKICDLSRYTYGAEQANFGKAYDACKALAKEPA
jgi:hypothetical protein